jgi:hypothetical protein
MRILRSIGIVSSVAVVTAALVYLYFYSTCRSIIVPSARVAGGKEIKLDLPVIPNCYLANFYTNKSFSSITPRVKIENVEISGSNLHLTNWEQSKNLKTISLTFSPLDDKKSGIVDAVNFTLQDNKVIRTDVKVSYKPLQYTADIPGTDHIEILPMTVRPGQLEPTGVTLVRYTLPNAQPLETFGAGISYPNSTLLFAYWIPLSEFSQDHPETIPKNAIDLTQAAIIPGEPGVFYFSFSSTNVTSTLFVKACVEVYIDKKEPLYFGAGQCEETTSSNTN